MDACFRPLFLAACLSGAVLATTAAAEETTFSPAQKTEIESLVREYILSHPEIIQEAFVKLEEKRKQAEETARAEALASVKDTLFSSPRQVTLGPADAPITVVEFFDYNCGYCKRALNDTLALLDQGDVKVVLKELPILSPGSTEAARVGIAVNLTAPDRYLEFHQAMLTGPGQADERRAMAVVEDLGLDKDAVVKAMDDPEVAATIQEVYGLANKLGLSGTPSYVIADEVLFGAVGLDALNARVAAVRECGKTVC
jgi:protein-disulfide isomerase